MSRGCRTWPLVRAATVTVLLVLSIGRPQSVHGTTGTHFVATKPALGSTCFYLRPPAPDGLSFLVERGTIRRADIVISTIRTTHGFRVGDPALKINTFYGKRARPVPDKYDPQAQTITIAPQGVADAKYRMVFWVKSGTVQAIIAGAPPQVLYVEGCS